jgi:hypothetical protein
MMTYCHNITSSHPGSVLSVYFKVTEPSPLQDSSGVRQKGGQSQISQQFTQARTVTMTCSLTGIHAPELPNVEGRQDPANASRRQRGLHRETPITKGSASALYTNSKICVCVCGYTIVHKQIQIYSPADKITYRLHSSRVNSYSLSPVSTFCTTSPTPRMMILLLFLQKQNLAFAVYQFGSVLSLPD